jgi:nucleoid-associated protein YgaU
MDLKTKYAELLQYAQSNGVENLQVVEKEGVLYVTGTATAVVKDNIWNIYDKLDPDMRAGDMVLNIEVKEGGEEIYEIKPGDSLSKIAKKYEGMTWQKIFEANKDLIKDPNKIFPGQKIKIPL